jgi:hypothetical protein
MNRINLSALALVSLTLAFSSMAQAQASRTWVSGVGDDANPCSRTAPCKTWAGAISKTAPGGEIDALDPGGFGALTITKSIVIDGGGGGMESTLVQGTNGFVVSAAATDVVTIRNVAINGVAGASLTAGLTGILFLNGRELHVENVVIENFGTKGIDFAPTATGARALFVRDTIVRNTVGGIYVHPTGGGTATAQLDNVRMDRNQFGIRVEDNAVVTVRNSVATNSVGNGFSVFSTSVAGELFIESSVASNNGAFGVLTSGTPAKILLSNVSIYGNGGGIFPAPGSQIISFGNNNNGNVASQGAPTSVVSQQ